jgi:serine/threonine protein kinase/tetratricopeptide (TPR) repeat protein
MPASCSAAADRNLLFGVLTHQMDFISRDALLSALRAWARDKDRPLGQVLVDQGQLLPEVRQLLEAMVDKHIQVHQGDAQRSLAAVASVTSLLQELQQIADVDVQATVDHWTVGTDQPGQRAADLPSAGTASTGVRYRVLRPHARGGLGEVFVAEDTELHREVALKEIRPEHAGDRISRERFVLEAEITGGLEHPGVVPVYGLGQHGDGRPFYAMRFIRGDSLREAIARFHTADDSRPRDLGERNIAFRELLGRFVDVCNAIAYAHSRGILHRDLKPGNVMLGKYGETLVVDWGLANVMKNEEMRRRGDEEKNSLASSLHLHISSSPDLTRLGTALGTPGFMSPEQAAGRLDQLGPASDVYSLGATLYALLTGQAPFQGDPITILRQVQNGDFLPPRRRKPDVPPALEAVCLKAMALRPEERYTTALQLAEDIEHWLADEPVSAWREPVTVKLGRWARQHRPLVSGAAAALLVGLLASGAGALWYQQVQADWVAEQERQVAAQERQAAEKVLQEERAAHARQQMEQDARSALQQAATVRNALQQVFAREGGLRPLLNDPAAWKGQLQQAQLHWDKARVLLARAGAGSDPQLTLDLKRLKQQLAHDEADRQLAERLEQIRTDKAVLVDGTFNFALAGREYPRAFAEAHLPVTNGDPKAVAALIHRSAIKEQLVAALDDWAYSAWDLRQPALAARLLEVARRADPDPWRDRVRDPATFARPESVKALADELLAEHTALDRLSPQMLVMVGNLLALTKGNAEEWLQLAQLRHPQDFWVNLSLGTLLYQTKPGEAAGYIRVALAVRPQCAAAWSDLGVILRSQKDLKGARKAYDKALDADPQFASAWYNLGNLLSAQKDLAGAADMYRKAVKIEPKNARAWNSLGTTLFNQKDLTGAVAAYEKAIVIDRQYASAWYNLGNTVAELQDPRKAELAYRNSLAIDPKDALVWYNLGNVLSAQRDLPGAVDAFQKAVNLDPQYAMAWYNLGNALRSRQDLPAAAAAYRKALAINPQHFQAWNNLGSALFGQKDWKRAADAYRKALAINPQHAKAWSNLGTVLVAQKDLKGAVAAFQKAIAVEPRLIEAHVNLSLAFQTQGEFRLAHKAALLAQSLLSPGHPLATLVQQRLQESQQALHQEQRALALVQGQTAPANVPELLQLAHFCRQSHRPCTAARLFATAFVIQPSLGESLATGHNAQAARAAALAAAGQGLDAAKLTAADRAQLRRQALHWLQADLKLSTQAVTRYQEGSRPEGPQPVSPLAKLVAATSQARLLDWLRAWNRLTAWSIDPALAGLRDRNELAKLPAAEQADWRQFWDDARSLEKRARTCFTERPLEGRLTAQRQEQVQEVKLQAGKMYVIDLESTTFDPVLRLVDDKGKTLAENDGIEPGVILTARLIFNPTTNGVYRLVVAAHLGQGTGAYVLRIREFAAPLEQPK